MKKQYLFLVAILFVLSFCTGCSKENSDNNNNNSSQSAAGTSGVVENNSNRNDGSQNADKAFSGEYGEYLDYDFVLPYPKEQGIFKGDFCYFFTSADGFDVYYCVFMDASGDLSDLINKNETSFIQAIRLDQTFDEDSIKMTVTSVEDDVVLDRQIKKITGYVEGKYDIKSEDGKIEKNNAKAEFVSDWYIIENDDSMFKDRPFAIVVVPNEIGSKTSKELDDYLGLIKKNMHK